MDLVPTNFLSSNMQPPETKGPVPSTDPDMGPSSSSRQIPHGNISESRDRKGTGDNWAMKMSAVLTQTWRDDLKSGHLPVSLFELLVKVFCPSFQLLRCLCSLTIGITSIQERSLFLMNFYRSFGLFMVPILPIQALKGQGGINK